MVRKVFGFVLVCLLMLSVVSRSDARLRRFSSGGGSSYKCKVCGKQHPRNGFLTPKTWLTFCHRRGCLKHDCGKHEHHKEASWLPRNRQHWENLVANPEPKPVPDADTETTEVLRTQVSDRMPITARSTIRRPGWRLFRR